MNKERGFFVKKKKDVPLDIIEKWLRDSDWIVWSLAMNACHKNGIQIPIIRSFEPPELVYKKCIAGVIVVAKIPSDAQVRGTYGRKCRTDKAVIVDVIGDFCGENVGISIHDRKTTYYVGDEIEIENFDYSDEECSFGYHFFCTKAEAEAYGT